MADQADNRARGGRRIESDADPGHSPLDQASDWVPADGLSDAERRMGFTPHTIEGAELDFVGRLDPSKRKHRIIAGVILFLMFGLPLLMMVWTSLTD